MSDLAATGCGNNDCGCGCGNASGFFNGGDSCSLIWLILILSCFGNGGCGCGNDGRCGGFSNGSSCDWLLLIILLSCFTGNCNNGCGCC